MKRHFPVIVEQDSDGVFIVECPILRGCRSYGVTMTEAMNNIREAIELCIEEDIESEGANIFVGIRDLELSVK